MAGQLITFPIRFGLRAASVAVRVGLQSAERAVALASFVVKNATSGGSGGFGGFDDADGSGTDEHTQTTASAASPAQASAPPPARAERAAAVQPPPQAEPASQTEPVLRPEPAHVSEQPSLVAEFAEPGAEDGAGAQVTIAEPWDGYAQLNAADVIARVSDATTAELATVELYEAAHRNRETVMTAVERALRANSGRGAATAHQTRKEHTNGG